MEGGKGLEVFVNVNVKVNGGVKIMRPVGSTVPVDRWSAGNWTSYNRAMGPTSSRTAGLRRPGTIAPTERTTDKLKCGTLR